MRLLQAGYGLMLSRGYPATTVDEICAKAEVSKGSFYHFFKAKQDLALELIEYHMEGAKEELEKGLDLEGHSEEEAAIAYVKNVERLAEEIWREGCLIGAFALEVSDTHPELRAKVSGIFRLLADDLEKLFTPLCRSYRGPDAPPPRELAEQFLVAIEGGVVLSRAHNDPRFVPQALRCFRRYLESLLRG